MADSVFDILSQKAFDEPPEIAAIKQYVRQHFQEVVEVTVRDRDILVSAPSAALAGTLRMHIPRIQRAAQTTKRIALRIA